jgi:hypothetical protein
MRPADFCHSHQPRKHPHLPCSEPRHGLRPARLEDLDLHEARPASAPPPCRACACSARALQGDRASGAPVATPGPSATLARHQRFRSSRDRIGRASRERDTTSSIEGAFRRQMPFAGLHRDAGFAAVPRLITLFARPGCPGLARPPSPCAAFATHASLGPALPADFCNTRTDTSTTGAGMIFARRQAVTWCCFRGGQRAGVPRGES